MSIKLRSNHMRDVNIIVRDEQLTLHTPPIQQIFRETNGAHLASPIRGELGYAHRPQLGSQIHCHVGHQI